MDARLKEMEQKLYNYFNKDKRLRALNKRLDLLKSQISQIDYKLEHIDYKLPEESIQIGYEERVQTSPTGYSFAEKTLYSITDKLIKNKAYKQQQIADIEDRIMQIQEDNTIIEDNIKDLRDGDKEFLKEKFSGYGKTDWQMGFKYGISQPAATERKKKLLKNILNWEDWVMSSRV